MLDIVEDDIELAVKKMAIPQQDIDIPAMEFQEALHSGLVPPLNQEASRLFTSSERLLQKELGIHTELSILFCYSCQQNWLNLLGRTMQLSWEYLQRLINQSGIQLSSMLFRSTTWCHAGMAKFISEHVSNGSVNYSMEGLKPGVILSISMDINFKEEIHR